MDLGGGNGNFVHPLASRNARLLTVDVDGPALRSAAPSVEPVAASLLHLPFCDGAFDGAAGRAILHHVPDDLDAALNETCRVVRPGGLVLFQEPTSGNVLANFARRRFPTERHEPGERPLPVDAYVSALRGRFEVLDVQAHFLMSYLLPHVVGRLPARRRRLGRALTRAVHALDDALLRALPRLRDRAAYVTILARRPAQPVRSRLEQPL